MYNEFIIIYNQHMNVWRWKNKKVKILKKIINIYLGIMLKHFTTIHSLPWSNFLSQKEIFFTLHCRWRWQPLEVCSLNTDRIHSQPSCCWTHGFYEIVVNVFTNALKLYDFFIFIILFTWIYLSCLKKIFFCLKDGQKS